MKLHRTGAAVGATSGLGLFDHGVPGSLGAAPHGSPIIRGGAMTTPGVTMGGRASARVVGERRL